MKDEMEIPKFVRLGTSALRLTGKKYYRDGGNWEVDYKIINGKLFSWMPTVKNLHKVELVKITEQQYADDNKGYYTIKLKS